MKRYGYIYDKICDIDNLRMAHKNARKGKGWYKEVKWVDEHLDECLKNIQMMLKNHTYKTSQYKKFYKTENGKIRTIYKLPYYPDRIVHWAIMQQIEDFFLKRFISDTYSSIPNKGTHSVARKLQKVLHRYPDQCTYCLKLDIKHFYQNINHNILKQYYRRMFKDNELLQLIDEIINSINTAEIEDLQLFYGDNAINYETGIPIGNYLSQYSGNLYLNELDHYIKEKLQIKYYFRYMDDIVILRSSKEELRYIKQEVEKFLNEKLCLMLKSNWQIFPVNIRGNRFYWLQILL